MASGHVSTKVSASEEVAPRIEQSTSDGQHPQESGCSDWTATCGRPLADGNRTLHCSRSTSYFERLNNH